MRYSRFVLSVLVTLAALAAGAPPLASASDPSETPPPPADSIRVVLEPIDVGGRIDDLIGIAASASTGRVGIEDFALRPIVREGELLETVPGMIVTQHSGEGKANQLFIRGFNLDHGSDFRTEVDGMPVNLPTHGHGQGWSDLNFLIPELVDYVEYKKGVYYADVGDFGSAGAARFQLARTLPHDLFRFDVGADDFARVVGACSRRVGPGALLVSGEIKNSDGPSDVPEDLEKVSGLARYTVTGERGELSILAMGYDNAWSASDQVPRRAVESGLIGDFGQIDSTLGGISSRYSVSADWRRATASGSHRANVYAIASDLDLFSNFTFFLDDPTLGDQIEQVDERVIVGGAYEHQRARRAWNREHVLRAGVQTRADVITEVGLHRARARQRTSTVRDDDVTEAAVGLFAEAESHWSARWRSVVGARGDLYRFDVESHRRENSGVESAGKISPKLSLAFAASPRVELYANAGFGFHSNDARGTTISVDPVSGEAARRVDPLVTSRGAEIGARVNPARGWRSTLSLWTLALDSELLFVGDAGGTEPTDESVRAGIEFANFYRPAPWLALDADLSVSRARLSGAEDADRIPGALERVLAAGVTLESRRGVFGAVRMRHLGAYPLIEDNSVRADPATLVNASIGYGIAGVKLDLTVLNVFDESASEIQYYYTSRLEGEPVEGLDDVHFTPINPREARLALEWSL